MFCDRSDAGRQLATKLGHCRGEGLLVLAIPCGGVEVGFHVATALQADFSILVSRKLPFPINPESGFGAVAEDGNVFLYQGFEGVVSRCDRDRIINEQRNEIKRRISVLREGRPLPQMKRRTVILVDDGIAMGSTMRVSIALCRKKEVMRIVVAVPVAGAETARMIGELADEVVVLEIPSDFRAVAQVYRNWYDVSDREALSLMKQWRVQRS
jgi:predicted phosphoribosyltransferase